MKCIICGTENGTMLTFGKKENNEVICIVCDSYSDSSDKSFKD